jgi:hypothetical protein
MVIYTMSYSIAYRFWILLLECSIAIDEHPVIPPSYLSSFATIALSAGTTSRETTSFADLRVGGPVKLMLLSDNDGSSPRSKLHCDLVV